MATRHDGKQTGAALTFGKILYRQVAAVIGAIAIAAMIRDLVELNWRSVLGTFVGIWDEYARPATKWAFDLVVTGPLNWLFGWDLEVPLLARDYFAVGLIYVFSSSRVLNRESNLNMRQNLLWGALTWAFWPILIVINPLATYFLRDEFTRAEFRNAILGIAPLVYLGLMFLANAVLAVGARG